LAKRIAGNIRQEYHVFNSGEPLPQGFQNWRNTRSARLLYADTVKVDAAYRKRAERHIREIIRFFFECEEQGPRCCKRTRSAERASRPTRSGVAIFLFSFTLLIPYRDML
jgi:hypothetical protein